MQSDRNWMPPQVQIRRQSQLLGASRDAVLIPDDQLGFVFPPNLVQDVETLDFRATRSFDSRGFPNTRSWPDKADIVFTGDSILMGEGVGSERSFVSLIDNRLPDYLALNLSLPGAGLLRQNRLLVRYGDELRPDLIVASLLISYDFLNDIHFSAWLDDSLGKAYNDFRLSFNRRANRGSSNRFARRIQRKALYSWLQSIIEPLLPAGAGIRHSATMINGQSLLFDREKVLFANRVFRETDPEIIQLAYALDELKAVSQRLNSDLLVMLLPSKEEVFAFATGEAGGNARELTRSMLEARNIDFLDVYDVVRSSALHRTPFFSADIHFNEFGNRVVADAFVSWFLHHRLGDLTRERTFDSR